ncbi:MAG: prepilin-type N-terminal cleavage/methylation domain-containing protein [Rickettsiales bacterium]|nr:prepilin-type N-terminal cleavage/methylation domain-containing protein [Rickettsiales bacterium]
MCRNKAVRGSEEEGFTLLELSVVIVIIGLLVAGILVGRDLIKSSELRATVGQSDKYNTAVQTFKLKYNAIPGDIRQTEASAFGLYTLTATVTGRGDGNGLVEGGSSGSTAPVGETILFWRHMYEAGFVDGAFGVQANSVLTAIGEVTSTVTTVQESLPPTKLTPQNSFVVFSVNGLNYFSILPVDTVTSAAYTFNTTGMTPINAFNIDVKLDDGKPNTGAIIARGIGAVNAAPTASATSTASFCTIGGSTATDTYNGVISTGGNDTSCGLRLRFQ